MLAVDGQVGHAHLGQVGQVGQVGHLGSVGQVGHAGHGFLPDGQVQGGQVTHVGHDLAGILPLPT